MSPESLPPPCSSQPTACNSAQTARALVLPGGGLWKGERRTVFGATFLGDPVLALEYKQHPANLLLG